MLNKYILILCLFASCATPKKLDRLMNKLPEAAAKECAERYPVKESIDSIIVVDSVAIQNYQNELFLLWKQLDSVLSIGCDTITKVKINEIIKTLPAKTETKVITRTIENTAQVQVLRGSIQTLTKTAMESKIKADNLEVRIKLYKRQIGWMWIVLLLLAIIIGRSFYKL